MADGKRSAPGLGLGRAQGRSWGRRAPGPAPAVWRQRKRRSYPSRDAAQHGSCWHSELCSLCGGAHRVHRVLYLRLAPQSRGCSARPRLLWVWAPGARRWAPGCCWGSPAPGWVAAPRLCMYRQTGSGGQSFWPGTYRERNTHLVTNMIQWYKGK